MSEAWGLQCLRGDGPGVCVQMIPLRGAAGTSTGLCGVAEISKFCGKIKERVVRSFNVSPHRSQVYENTERAACISERTDYSASPYFTFFCVSAMRPQLMTKDGISKYAHLKFHQNITEAPNRYRTITSTCFCIQIYKWDERLISTHLIFYIRDIVWSWEELLWMPRKVVLCVKSASMYVGRRVPSHRSWVSESYLR